MPIDTYITGNDGNFAYTINSSAQTLFKVRSFAATINRVVTDQTGFGDTGRRKRLGMLDLTGTLNATIGIDSSASTSSTSTANVMMSSQDTTSTRPAVTLTLYDGTGTTDAKITGNCVFSSFAFNSDRGGDSTVTVNFENADGTAPVVSWLV
jgi:hypothetical protein